MQEAYDRREDEMGEEVQRELERRVVLSVLDRKWREHLYEMDYLREGIYLRAYSQRDPLVEYQREGFDMFAAMMDGIKEESVGFLFNLQVEVDEDDAEGEEAVEVAAAPQAPQVSAATPQIDFAQAQAHAPQIRAKGLEKPNRPQNLSYSAPSEDGEAEVHARRGDRRGRRVRGSRSQLALPVRLRPEVQALPRRPRRGLGLHDARRRLTRAQPRSAPADRHALPAVAHDLEACGDRA